MLSPASGKLLRPANLITHNYRAFREAHGVTATVVQPPLGRLRRLASRPNKAANPTKA